MLQMAEFERKRIDFISREKVIKELKKVAQIFNYQYFKKRDFDKHSVSCKSTKVISLYGSWESALKAIGIENTPIRKLRKDRASDEDILFEIIRIWKIIGHRPSKAEWESNETHFSYSTIKQRYEGWINACNEAFNIMNQNTINLGSSSKTVPITNNVIEDSSCIITQENKHDIPLKLRLKVLKRDHFKCVLCGRNPANEPSVELHIDHIIPFSKGGKTNENNLRTLCRECNLGKGNDENY
jgi:hypothetical protein